MHDVSSELKVLRMPSMAGAWANLKTQAGPEQLQRCQWLMEHLLQAEGVDRVSRSVDSSTARKLAPAASIPGSLWVGTVTQICTGRDTIKWSRSRSAAWTAAFLISASEFFL